MTTETQDVDAQESDAHQQVANEAGAWFVSLESSWWGNEKFGEWGEDWWAKVDHETEDALHVTAFCGGSSDPRRRMVATDTWLPKSVMDVEAQPQWRTHSPDGDVEGELKVMGSHMTKYGKKHELAGDTYEAFKECGLDDALSWEKTHATFNGDAWELDATSKAMKELIEEANEAGFEVKTLAA